jgi:hypothetical protein
MEVDIIEEMTDAISLSTTANAPLPDSLPHRGAADLERPFSAVPTAGSVAIESENDARLKQLEWPSRAKTTRD